MLIVGAGSRGAGYSKYAESFPEQACVVGVAEPREHYRRVLAETHSIPEEHVYNDWKELANVDRFADAVIIATQDKMHTEPTIMFAEKGYNILLEKPMAPTEEECRKIVDTALRNQVIFAVCHVLRYTNYTQKLKELLDSGVVGDIVNIQHLEPVGYWHQAHSFVRGNWRNEGESSAMLLAKCCHDTDWLQYIMGERCVRISSFGNLKHFRKENQPQNASDRCMDCQIEAECPYSARKIYLGRVAKGQTYWPVDVLTPDVSEESITEAIRSGPYGRCVYACDNDVVDHQVVNMVFENNSTASLTMTAFTFSGGRRTNIFGTHGEINADSSVITCKDFLTDEVKTIDSKASDSSILGGHGGGDFGLMKSFVEAVANGNPGLILSGPVESFQSHQMVFAAEESRKTGTVVELPEMFSSQS